MRTKIIVIDDSRTARQQVKLALGHAEYEVIEAVDGLDGISKISENADAPLVLCDINMPNLDGLDMVEALSEETRSAHLFLMLTTESEPRLIERAKLLGAKGWIGKPFNPEMLLAAVRKLVGAPTSAEP